MKLYRLTVQELSEICKKNKFLLVQAHPFRDIIELPTDEFIDNVEVYNCLSFTKFQKCIYQYLLKFLYIVSIMQTSFY